MSPLEKHLFLAANLLVGGTGLVYGWFRYFATSDDPFAVVNHPAQPLWQHLHIWLAPLLVLAVGHFLYHHALLYWRAGTTEGRRSGLSMLALAPPMIFSGYLLQTAVDETWRQVWIGLHVATSLLWLAGVGVHLLSHYASRRAETTA